VKVQAQHIHGPQNATEFCYFQWSLMLKKFTVENYLNIIHLKEGLLKQKPISYLQENSGVQMQNMSFVKTGFTSWMILLFGIQ
jgi:hypothetical protein